MEAGQTKTKWSYVLDEPTRILVVDDDPLLREFAIVNLSTPVAQVETVADGSKALDLMLVSKFDIAVIDIEMPGLSGFELVERARTHESLRELPIVMLTGREDIASIDRAYAAGATAFVTKPVNWRLLSYQLRYVLRATLMEAAERQARLRLMQRELCATVNSIIGFANRIAPDCTPEAAKLHADCAAKIAAAGQDLLSKLMNTAQRAHSHGATSAIVQTLSNHR